MSPEAILEQVASAIQNGTGISERLSDVREALASRDAELAARDAELSALREELARQAALVRQLQRMLFGRKSEKGEEAPSSQLELFGSQQPGEAPGEDAAQGAAQAPQERAEKAAAPRKARKPIPDDLPRQVVVLEPAISACGQCGEPMREIGRDVTEKLVLVPQQLSVIRYERPRYACPGCKAGVTQAPLPPMALPRSFADESLITGIAISKYADHQPLYRIAGSMARHRVILPRAVTCGMMMETGALLTPLWELMGKRERELCAVICADETPLRMMPRDKGSGKTEQAWMWCYHGDEAAPYVFFDFQLTRGSCAPLLRLEGYSGWLVTDAYAAYGAALKAEMAREGAGWRPAGCWAHARRKFMDALRDGDGRAARAVALVAMLYEVEKEAREAGLDHHARLALRREKSLPVLAQILAWLGDHAAQPPKTPLGKAVGYALNNWERLMAFTTDGRLPIDNNAVERAVRPLALGRKNWLFAGSERGGRATAVFMSLVESAKRAGVNLWDYFNDILRRIPAHPVNRLEELLPDQWKPLKT